MRNLIVRALVIGCATLALASLYTFLTRQVEAANGPFNGKIIFASNRDVNKQIYLMNINTSVVNLSNNSANDEDPDFSPDGSRIVFTSDRDGGPPEIYVMGVDGSNPVRLTFNDRSDISPAWSPDGTKIAFVSTRDGNFEIYVMNADGTNQARLTNNPALDRDPQWSPDGKKIVFDRADGPARDVFLMNANGANQARLVTEASEPSFSFDGTKIVFVKTVGFHPSDIFVVNADGTNPVQLTFTSSQNLSPAFSPDGTKIVFTSSRGGTTVTDFDIFTMDSNGANLDQLTDGTMLNFEPDWQPLYSPESIGVFRPSTGQWLVRNTPTAGFPDLTFSFGQSGDLPVTGDWNGDGLTDVGVYRGNTFLLAVLKIVFVPSCKTCPATIPRATLDAQPLFIFGQAGDLPVAGDWNGDGVDEVGVFRNGQFLIRQPSPLCPLICRPTTVSFNFGQAGDQPVAGDWNGDGRDTVGTFNAGNWALRNSNSAGPADITVAFGTAFGSKPVVGDWNHDAVDTIGVLVPSSFFPRTTFGLNNVNANLTGNFDILAAFGADDDIPVAGDWDGFNNPPNSGVNDPDGGSSRVGQTQTFITTCSDPDGWHNISTIDFKIARSDGNGSGVPVPLWVQFDEGSNLIRLYDPDLQTWSEGVPGANVVLSSRFADLYLSGTQVQGSGPTGISVQVTWQVVFKNPVVMNNYKQYLKITDDAGLTTGFDKVGSWGVTK